VTFDETILGSELVDEVDGFDEMVALADDVSSAKVSSPSMSSTHKSTLDESATIRLTELIHEVG
jgi:hypothetical protein